MVETEGPQMTSQYGAFALHAGLARLQARICKNTPTRPGIQMNAHTRTHARTDQYLLLFHGNNDSRTRVNVTLFVHCLSYFRFCRKIFYEIRRN